MEFGETFAETAQREIKEETGLDIGDQVEVVSITNNIMPKDNVHSITIWLKTPFLGGEPQIREPDKFVDQNWFTLESLPQPLFQPWNELLSQEFEFNI